MKYTEQELAEKMKQRLANERDRQRRWRIRQKEKGLKPVAGMISQKAFDIITKKKEAGETVSEILEKALLNMTKMSAPSVDECTVETNNIGDRTHQKRKDPEYNQEYKNDIINRIKKMRAKENLPFNEIAKIFNQEGLETLTGEELWDGKTIYTIFKNL